MFLTYLALKERLQLFSLVTNYLLLFVWEPRVRYTAEPLRHEWRLRNTSKQNGSLLSTRFNQDTFPSCSSNSPGKIFILILIYFTTIFNLQTAVNSFSREFVRGWINKSPGENVILILKTCDTGELMKAYRITGWWKN